MQEEIRKIPNKTKFIMVALALLGIIIFLVITSLKEAKIAEILNNLGHTNISNINVINKLSVEDKQTRKRSTVYKVVFFDNKKNQQCIGFLHHNTDGKYLEDIDCK